MLRGEFVAKEERRGTTVKHGEAAAIDTAGPSFAAAWAQVARTPVSAEPEITISINASEAADLSLRQVRHQVNEIRAVMGDAYGDSEVALRGVRM